MPRNVRRRLHNPNKNPLNFVEAPINGVIHQYGIQERSAINPKSFISDERRQNTTSWVSPQFDQIQVAKAARTRRKGGPAQSTSNVKHSPSFSKGLCEKYTPLSFENNDYGLRCQRKRQQHFTVECHVGRLTNQVSNSMHPLKDQSASTKTIHFQKEQADLLPFSYRPHEITTEERASSPKNTRNELVNTFELSEACHSQNVEGYSIPLNVHTPEMPSSKMNFENLLLPSTPAHSHHYEILVQDTPEKDYGLKVTWRNRKEQMRLLIHQGQLTKPQVMVAGSS